MFRPVLPKQVLSSTRIRWNSTFPKGDLKKFVIDSYRNTAITESSLPAWQRGLGESVISMFNIDIDKTRSGPVGGQIFKEACKGQGYYSERSPANTTEHQKFYYETLGLPRTFQQQFQISALHIWMIFVRLRALPRKYCREYQQKMINAVFEDLGHRMRNDLKVTSESIINTNKKHLNEQLRGAIFAYDEGFYTSDATLAAAIWRNLFDGRKDVDMRHLEQLVHYVRTQLFVFDNVSDRDFAGGRMLFVEPWNRYDALTEKDNAEIKKVAEESRRELLENPKPSQKSVLSEEGW